MKYTTEQIRNIAETAVKDILNDGLGNSTWKDAYPDAYAALLDYREDIIQSIVGAFKKVDKK